MNKISKNEVMYKKYVLLIIMLITVGTVQANVIQANSNDYTKYVRSLKPGDTLMLAPGVYTDRLNVFSIEGTAEKPIVIMGSGDGTVFIGNACCNTVSIKEAAFVVLKNFKIDGKNIANIDGIKAEGTSGNWSHHITIENITIVGHGKNQQTVAISTKCTSWDWTIRKCTIDAAGTGLYLGNSNGESPFVNGIIENNLIKNTVGYNMQIKHQNVGSRNVLGMPIDGKTIIRDNVFSKESNASSGNMARPNLLVGNFPETGDGENDYYEIYGNFFWQNPNESLFQGTGNIMFYNNICVNYAGGNGVTFQEHNYFEPRDIKIFNNTVICDINWGIRLMYPDQEYKEYIYGNAVFSNTKTPIRVVGKDDTIHVEYNVEDSAIAANNYVNNAVNNINTLDLFPIIGTALNSDLIPNDLFHVYTNYNKDFNNETRDWHYRGAYSGEGVNPGWELAIALKDVKESSLGIDTYSLKNEMQIYPNPVSDFVNFKIPFENFEISVFNINGVLIKKTTNQKKMNLSDLQAGFYLVRISSSNYNKVFQLIKK